MLVFEETRLLIELQKIALDNKPTADLMPFSDLKPLTTKYVYQVWQKEWDETGRKQKWYSVHSKSRVVEP